MSMMEGQLSLLHGVMGAYLADGVVPEPMGTAYTSLLPYQTFRTRTKDIAIGVGSDKLWRLLCPILGLDALATDARFATNPARNANRAAMVEALQTAFLTRPYEEWEPLLIAAGIPVGGINTMDQVATHPQVIARESLVECEHPIAGRAKLVRPPVRLSETPGSIRTPAPLLGEHTDVVLRERLGMSDAEIAALRRAGVVA
jgi:crotonobetainyl-CoA:carnitine CoA-transferase CaiB-like acyl-CoA transferase